MAESPPLIMQDFNLAIFFLLYTCDEAAVTLQMMLALVGSILGIFSQVVASICNLP
jgi:hypothetical protein